MKKVQKQLQLQQLLQHLEVYPHQLQNLLLNILLFLCLPTKEIYCLAGYFKDKYIVKRNSWINFYDISE